MAKKETAAKHFFKTVGRLSVAIFTNKDDDTGLISFSTYIRRSVYSRKKDSWIELALEEEDLKRLPDAQVAALKYIAAKKANLDPSQLA